MSEEEQTTNFFTRFFVPRRDYIVTPVIFYLNLLMFIIVSVYDKNFWYPSPSALLLFGADAPALTIGGDWWRLITACFIHIGILHFAANMFALMQLGFILENFVGSLRLAAGYIFFGIAGNVASNWWYADSYMNMSAGASGAIFGLLGFFLALVTTEFVRKESRMRLLKSIGLTILINVIISLNAHINSAAHFGGMIAGIVGGYLIWILYKLKLPKRELIFSLFAGVFSIVLMFIVLPALPDTTVKVNEFFTRLEEKEKKIYNNADSLIGKKLFTGSDIQTIDREYTELIKKGDSLNSIMKTDETPVLIQGYKQRFALNHDILVVKARVEAGETNLIPKMKELEEQKKKLEAGEEI